MSEQKRPIPKTPVAAVKTIVRASLGRASFALAAKQKLTPAKGAKLLDRFRANGLEARPTDEWRTELEARLMAHPKGEPLYVFGYGSLMWNPMVKTETLAPATLNGLERRFCMNVTFGRGSADAPGLMLALDEADDKAQSCMGRLLHIAPKNVESALTMLWLREMGTGGYLYRDVTAQMADSGQDVPAITFTVNRAGDRYLGHLPLADQAHRIAHAEGLLGTNYDYLKNLMDEMGKLEIEDPYLTALWAAVEERRG